MYINRANCNNGVIIYEPYVGVILELLTRQRVRVHVGFSATASYSWITEIVSERVVRSAFPNVATILYAKLQKYTRCKGENNQFLAPTWWNVGDMIQCPREAGG